MKKNKCSTTKLRLSNKVNDGYFYSHVFEFQSDNISPFIDHILILIYILTLMYFLSFLVYFLIVIILLTLFTRPHKLY